MGRFAKREDGGEVEGARGSANLYQGIYPLNSVSNPEKQQGRLV